MRITQSMIVRNVLNRLNRSTENLDSLQGSIATGKRVTRASDDPASFSRASRLKEASRQNDQYMKNITNGNMLLDTASDALDPMYSLVLNAKGMATQGADGAMDDRTRQALATQLGGIIEEVTALANSQNVGKNIFAGTQTRDVQPFIVENGTVTYNGNDEQIERQVSNNFNVAVNVTGQQLLDTEIFTQLIDLKTALENNDIPNIQAAIDIMATVGERLLGLTASVSSNRSNMNLIEQRLNSANLNLASFISQEEDADLGEVIVQFESEEFAYRAALQSSAKIMNLNIMNFIGL